MHKMLLKTRLLLLLMVPLLVFSSCGKKRNATSEKASKVTETPVVIGTPILDYTQSPGEDTILQFDELSAKLKVTSVQAGTNRTFNATLRWKKGERIWVSMGILGIEGVRLMITPDSIQLIDRINAEFLNKPYSYLQKYTKMNIPFEDLERLLKGLPVRMDANQLKISNTDTSQIWKSTFAGTTETSALFTTINKMLIEFNANDTLFQRSLFSRYSDFRTMNGKLFPFERYIFIRKETESMEITMKFTELQLASGLSYPFDIPAKYNEID